MENANQKQEVIFNEEVVIKEFEELTGLKVGNIKEDNLSDYNKDIIYFEIETEHKKNKLFSHNDEISKTIEIVRIELRKIGINDYSITNLKKIGYEKLNKLFKTKSPESLKIGTHAVINCLFSLLDREDAEYYTKKLRALWKNKPLKDTKEDFDEKYQEYLIHKNTENAEIHAKIRVKEDFESEPEIFNKTFRNRVNTIEKSDFEDGDKDVNDVMSRWAVDSDGFAHFLNTYDNDYLLTKSEFVVMRIN